MELAYACQKHMVPCSCCYREGCTLRPGPHFKEVSSWVLLQCFMSLLLGAGLTSQLSECETNKACVHAGVKMQKAAQLQGSSTDDRLYAFEAAGQLLGTEDLAASEQETAVRGLLQPLQQQIDEQLKAARAASAGRSTSAQSPDCLET